MKTLTTFYKRHSYVYSLILLIIVISTGFALAGSKSSTSNDTITVHPQDFNQELSVSGTVIAAQNVDLGFAQAGRIVAVRAKVGDQVKAGTLLAQVENGDLAALLQQKQAALDSARANLTSVQNGTRPEQLAVTQEQVTSDQTAVAQARQTTITTLKSVYATADSALSTSVDQLFSSPRTNPNFGVSINGANNTNYFIDGGALKETVNNERRQLNDLLTKWSALNTKLSTDQDIAATNVIALQTLQVAQDLVSNVSIILAGYSPQDVAAQSIYNGYKTSISGAASSITAAVSSLNNAGTAQVSAQGNLDRDQRSLQLALAGSTATDIASANANVKAASADVASAAAQLAKTLVRAPFDGIITKMDAKVGEIVSSNTSEISLNSNGVFQIESYVPEVYVSNLHVGDVATTTLDAFGTNTYFGAIVVSIDPAQTTVNGVSNYKTTLQFAKADDRIKSGMTANIIINTGNVPNAFVVPQGAVFTKTNQKYVQIKEGKKTSDVAVVTGGASSIGNIQIISGLRDGDMVVLTPDTTK